MKKRIINQFQGFLRTPSIFLQNFLGLILFHKNLETPHILPDTLELNEIRKNTVLGKRVEQFFKAAIEADENFKVVANNIQIQNDKRTLGELDFILKDLKTFKLFHIELMYKYYVYDPLIPVEMERWIGPNRNDTLLQKIEKVKTNQFPLLKTPEAKKFLNSINIDSVGIQQQICFKASLFIPKELSTYNFPHINKECIIGFWVHLKDFSKYNKTSFKFFAPEKQDWPVDPKYGKEWFNFMEISEQIQILHLRNKSPIIWIKKPNGSFERIIVVWW